MNIHGQLRAEEIENALSSAEHFYRQLGAANRDGLVFVLNLEETLLIYRDMLGETAQFDLQLRRAFSEIRCILSVRGNSVDISGAGSEILEKAGRSSGMSPVWKYRDGCNYVTFSVPLYNTAASNMKFVWQYVARRKGLFFLAVASQWVNVAMNILAPVLSARVIVAYTDSAMEQILWTALAIFIVRLFSDYSLFLCNTKYNRVYTSVLSEVETDLADASLRIKNACIEEKGGGLFIQRLTVDTSTLATGFNTIADMVSQMCRYIGVLIAMLVVSPPVFLVVFLLMAGQTAVELIRTKHMTKDDRIYRTANERFSGFVGEMVHGLTDIKVLNSEKTFHEELARRVDDANDSRMNMIMNSWKYKLVRWGIADMGRLGFICLLGLLIVRYGMAPAMVLVLYSYYTELDASAILLVGELLEFVKGFNLSAERVCALINSPEFPKEEFGTKHLDDVKGEICFEHVSFSYESEDPRYPSRRILNDMSFVIPAGTTAALVGRSGCGKSTALRVLCRLNEAERGTIRMDGVNIRLLDKETLRGNMTAVSQNPYLFHMTIRENLQLVKHGLSDEEMESVCRKACIHDDIVQMPKGYDSLIGEGGVNLSGGQRQRLALARCLLKPCGIILLDEATSALDNVTQKKIQEAMENLRGTRTIILIAHRLSTVINADKIMFMEDGKILDEGSHEELLARCSSYRELYQAEEGIRDGK